MSKKLICLISFVLVLSLVGNVANAAVEDGLLVLFLFEGNLDDSSGNGYHGSGSNYSFEDGLLVLNGSSNSYMDAGAGLNAVNPVVDALSDFTIAIAYACTNTGQGFEAGNSLLLSMGPTSGAFASGDFSLFTNNDGQYIDHWWVDNLLSAQSGVGYADGNVHLAIITYEAATNIYTFYHLDALGDAVTHGSGTVDDWSYEWDETLEYTTRVGNAANEDVDLDFGPQGEGAWVYLDGKVDYYAIWDRLLTIDEMAHIPSLAPAPGPGPSNGNLLINGSFEDGLTGWDTYVPPGGSITTVSSHSDPGGTGTTYWAPTHGNKFALMKTNGAGQEATLSQTFYAEVGYILSFDYFWDSRDYMPFNDSAKGELLVGGSPVATLFTESVETDPEDFWGTDWKPVSYTFTNAGEYTLRFSISNSGDSAVDSYIGIDNVILVGLGCPLPPEPNNPDPCDGAIDVPMDTNLSWDTGVVPPLPPVTITFDEVPTGTGVNGMVIGNVTFSFSSSDASVTFEGPGQTTFIDPPNIEGNRSGTLTLDFATPVYGVSYGFALSNHVSQTNATSMTLFDALLHPVLTVSANADDLGFGYVEGMNSGTSTSPIVHAVIVFSHPGATRFALDNLTYSPSVGGSLSIPMAPAGHSAIELDTAQPDESSLVGGGSVHWQKPGDLSVALEKEGVSQGVYEGNVLSSAEVSEPRVTSYAAVSVASGPVVNGDFETGDFSGWTLMDSGSGTFSINNGTFDPSGPDGPLPPYSGGYSAISHQPGPGVHTIYQGVAIPGSATSARLYWADMIRNHADRFSHPNQEFRVEIWNTNNQVLATLFTTNPGDPMINNWTTRSADISQFAGMTIRLAFTEQDNLGHFNVHLDDIRIEEVGGGGYPTTWDVYLGTDANVLELICEDVNEPNCDPTPEPGEKLNAHTTYYWQVVAKNSCGETEGDEWSFTTENTPPDANAGHDQTVECGCNTEVGTEATLDGTGSYDADGDELTYTWTGPIVGSPVYGPTPTVTLLDGCPGDYVITLEVNDGYDTDTDDVQITVVDTTPPTVNSVSADPNVLWPPNHKMVEVAVTVEAEDDCDEAPVCQIVDVTSNEPINSIGDGNTAPDWAITGDFTVKLRAERAGGRTGRVYTIHIECTDASGNTIIATVEVTVPHDQGEGKAKK